jgi:hypothetical protein
MQSTALEKDSVEQALVQDAVLSGQFLKVARLWASTLIVILRLRHPAISARGRRDQVLLDRVHRPW